MPASFTDAVRKIKHRGINKDTWIPIPPFWYSYVYAHYGKRYVKSVIIDMDEEGTLTIKPYWKETKGGGESNAS